MKKLLLLLSIAFMAIQSSAQFVNYERDGGWNLGFNLGGTWQPKEGFGGTSEFSKPYAGFGGGFTLGKSLYEKEGAFLAFDLRGRYLGSSNYGWVGVPVYDSTITGDTTSIVFRNYKMKLNELSLEGVITLHRLREKTGIILYGFGGIGATQYTVESDLYDNNGNFHVYDSSFIQNSAEAIATDLRFESDRNFETTLQNKKWSLVPSLGFGLGYQITKSFSIGVEHKIAYDILGDEFDGGSLNNLADAKMDKYHYTALNFRWNLLGRGETYKPVSNNNPNNWTTPPNNTNTTPPPSNITQESKPLVNIYNPANNNMVVHNSAYTIKAKIYNVAAVSGVTFKQNGLITNGFTYNPSSNEFSAQVYLQPGNNTFEITGVNTAGSDKDSRIIIYKMPEEFTTAPAPIVSFSNPSAVSSTVTQAPFNVVASVLNVLGKGNITFTVNGVNSNSFTYSTSNKVLTSAVLLQEGNNTITIKGVNAVGSDVKTVNIIYKKPAAIKPPVVTIHKPNSNPFNTNSPVEVIQASAQHVMSKGGVKVIVNGNNLSNFSFDNSSKKISFSANLIVGANVIQVIGTNTAGTDSKSTTIIYRVSEVMPLPVVDFTVPSVTPYNTSASNMTITAAVLNVTSKNYITINFNGQNLTNFTYNSTTKQVAFNVNLVTGNNIFKITATNSSGSDSDDQIVIRQEVQNQMPPVVNITNPNSNPHNTTVGTQIVNATISNVDNISGVSAKFNGASITNFTFDHVTDKFVYTANLLVGANVIEITGTNNVGTASKSQTIIYTEPVVGCDEPTIALTQPKTSTKTLLVGNSLTINTSDSKGAIVGKISNANSVDFKIDGQSSPGYNYNASTGHFESFLHLKEGANTYQIIATNNCGTETQNLTFIYSPKEIPCDKPAINFMSPGNSPHNYTGPKLLSTSTSILGVTSATQISCKLNNSSLRSVFDDATGTISANLSLAEGTNTFKVTATNDCGTTEAEMVIIYTAPIAPPTVTIVNPSPTPHSTTNGNVNVKANVTNVASAAGVQVLLDGQSINNFNFNNNTKQVSFNLSLAIGSHQVLVKATNNAGTAQDNAEIIIIEEVSNQCDDPTIVMTAPQRLTKAGGNPTISVTTEDNTAVIAGTFSNTTTVGFTANGQNSSNFTFSPSTGSFNSNVTLNPGANTYQIIASNSCGTATASQTIVIEYTPPAPPCEAPSVSMLSPNTTQIATTNPTETVSIRVMNISSEAQVFSKLNNAYINQNYNAASGVLTLNLTLAQGSNELVVMAKNECGSDEVVVNLTYTIQNPSNEGEGEGGSEEEIHDPSSGTSDPNVVDTTSNSGGNFGGGNGTITTGGTKPNAGGNGNNGHGNNEDGVDSSNPGQGGGGPNGSNDPSGNTDDENGNGNGNGTNIGQQGTQDANGQKTRILNEKYSSEIQKADSYYNAKNYSAASNAYFNALELKPTESYPKQRLQEIEQIRKEVEANAKNEAAAKAEQAAKLKAQQEAAAKAKAEEAAKLKAQQDAAAKAKAEQAAKLKAQQDAAAKAQQEAAAKAKAEQAAKLKAQQAAAAKAKAEQEAAAKAKAQQEAAAKEKGYNDLIKKGDLYFKAGKYSTAKTYYTQALGYKPNSTYAKGKLTEIEKKMTVKPATKPTITKPTGTKPKVTVPTNTSTPKSTGGGTDKKTVTKPVIKPKASPTVKPTVGGRNGG